MTTFIDPNLNLVEAASAYGALGSERRLALLHPMTRAGEAVMCIGALGGADVDHSDPNCAGAIRFCAGLALVEVHGISVWACGNFHYARGWTLGGQWGRR